MGEISISILGVLAEAQFNAFREEFFENLGLLAIYFRYKPRYVRRPVGLWVPVCWSVGASPPIYFPAPDY